MEYAGRTVVITGSASGLGAAMADLFARAGAKLALLDIDGERAATKADDLRRQGVDVLALGVDVADRTALDQAAAAVKSRFGGCDVLCANVAVQQFGAIEKLSASDWSWMMSVNVMGTIHTVAAFLPIMRERQGERHILLTASACFFQPAVRMGAYVTTKYAVVGYGEVLRQELADEGINVALLFPAGMLTRHYESSAKARPKELGESWFDRSDVDAMVASGGLAGLDQPTSADHAVRNLLSELRRKSAYIITHGGYKARIEANHRDVIAAFDRMTSPDEQVIL